MAVRCVTCGRLSRDEIMCEWCHLAIPPAARPLAATGPVEAGEEKAPAASLASLPPSPSAAGDAGVRPGMAAVGSAATEGREDKAGEAEREAAERAGPEELAEPPVWYWDPDTRVILPLILLQFGLTLYLGRLSSWWSLTGFLWLVVAYGVVERLSWSLALPLVLFTLDVALLLFGVGPRERAGFISLAPFDFFLYLLRLVIWALIWRLQDQLD
jgi:hypothetical protein